MAQIVIPVDIEETIADIYGIHATPKPADLGASLPYAVVSRTGGGRADLVVDNHFVDVDVYSDPDDWAGATAEASRLLALMADCINKQASNGAVLYAATVEALPYNNPDPDHPTLARSTFSMRVTARGAVVEVEDQ